MSRQFFADRLAEQPRPRRGVRIVRLEAAPATGMTRYAALCACGWDYLGPIRAAVEEQARWHREQHRRSQSVETPAGVR